MKILNQVLQLVAAIVAGSLVSKSTGDAKLGWAAFLAIWAIMPYGNNSRRG
jgi:hypothetical protein